ncbi:hypothetical protein CPB84DRAFT_1798256 [Gymnopilus junonius]|uniref:DUF4470 domain-containing protein n=1 Tax=Gymnopilus junonius TaxID=109634 RepID=A0A9P5N949_GYMJU|nr:hypothetical protein CPB84DRAFT_1798256 [Gymnopilus junonius]
MDHLLEYFSSVFTPDNMAKATSIAENRLREDMLPCANVQAGKYTTCSNPGTSACSACKLACQKEHWRHHKRDCQNSMRSGNWQPIWVREGREPSFIRNESLEEESVRRTSEGFSIGIALWGNTPAMDVLNLSCNENDPKKDFSLAFIGAFGDLRHVIRKTQEGEGAIVPLGQNSTMSVCLPQDATEFFLHFISSSASMEKIQNEYDRVRTAPSRKDYRDRMYTGLRPSHRVAFQEFRRFGIVLPFGAINAHFNVPNLSLFSLEGTWWQTDYADPLEAWDMATVVKTGKVYGANVEDIYGCLYFFLSKELREFAHRFRTMKSSFTMTCFDARRVPQMIHEGLLSEYNLPPSIRFDRIEVSNILDANYVGINEGKNAAIVGYFMNWISLQQDARASRAGGAAMMRILPAAAEKNKVKEKGRVMTHGDIQSLLFNSLDDIEALYDNSKPFSAFLRKQGLDSILKKTNLRLREKHKIVPHRILAPLTARPNALPEFPDDDTWYYYTKLNCSTWAERFVEFERA